MKDSPPASLILCRIIDGKGRTYENCRVYLEHISCVRWLEKELFEKGIKVNPSIFSPAEYWRERVWRK